MKIQCEQCKIEYSIDDASIGERGIRAQCPKCNHITTIRKSQSAMIDRAREKLESLPAICVNCGKPCAPNPNDPIPVCESCQALGGEAGQKTTVGGAQLPPGGDPLAGLPGFDRRDPSPAFGATNPSMPMFGNTNPTLTSPNPDNLVNAVPASGGSIPQPSLAPQESADQSWRIKKSPNGEIYGPFDRELITGWIATDKIVAADEICREGGPWQPASSHEDFKDLFANRGKGTGRRGDAAAEAATSSGGGLNGGGTDPDIPMPPLDTAGAVVVPSGKAGDIRTARGGAMAMAAGRLGARPAAQSRIPRWIFPTIGGVVIVAVLGVGVVMSGVLGKLGGGKRTGGTPTPVTMDEGPDRQIGGFAHDFPNATGTAEEHVAAGRTDMAADTVVGWRSARTEFGQALALQRSNLEALAGLAEMDALLGEYAGEIGYLREAIDLSSRAVERGPNLSMTNRAKAAALIASGGAPNLTDARGILTSQVLTKSSSDAIALTMMGVALAGTDNAAAEADLKKADQMNPNLIRPKLELGSLYYSQNRFQKALETFKSIASRSYLAAYKTGQIEERVGRYREAEAAYQSAARVAAASGGGHSWVEAQVAAAVVDYQALDHLKEAAAALSQVEAKVASGEVKLKPDLEGKLKLQVAIVDRLLGGAEDYDKSLKLSNEVIALRETLLTPAAHFNAALVKLRKGDFDGSDHDFDESDVAGLPPRVKSEIYFWQGQLKQRRGDSGAAGQRYEDSFHEDGQNWHPIVAEASMMAGAADQEIAGLDKMQELAHLDPEFYDSQQKVTLFFPDPTVELLAKADKAFEKIYPAHSTDSRASTSRAMVAFLSRNPAKAKTYLNSALSESNPDNGAIVYSALLLEQKGGAADLKGAIDRFTQVKTNSPSPFLSMVVGRCYLKLGKLDDAAGALTEALQQTPDYTPAQYWMGMVLQKKGDKRAAIAKFGDALRDDPGFLKASQAMAEQDGAT